MNKPRIVYSLSALAWKLQVPYIYDVDGKKKKVWKDLAVITDLNLFNVLYEIRK